MNEDEIDAAKILAEMAEIAARGNSADVKALLIQRRLHLDLVMARIKQGRSCSFKNPDSNRRVKILELPDPVECFAVPFKIGDVVRCPYRGENDSWIVQDDRGNLYQLAHWECKLEL